MERRALWMRRMTSGGRRYFPAWRMKTLSLPLFRLTRNYFGDNSGTGNRHSSDRPHRSQRTWPKDADKKEMLSLLVFARLVHSLQLNTQKSSDGKTYNH